MIGYLKETQEVFFRCPPSPQQPAPVERDETRDTPDRLVGQPACVAVVKAVLKGGHQVFGRGDGGAHVMARLNRCREIQSVAAGLGAVVEDDAWSRRTERETVEIQHSTTVSARRRHLLVWSH